jgi:signal peptide peptidase SppA
MNTRFLAWCLSTPWAMQPEAMRAFAMILARRYGTVRAGDHRDDTQYDDAGNPMPKAQAAAARVGSPRSGAVAVIPVRGAIVQHASSLGPCEGGTSTQSISQTLRQANADESISSIVLDIDSPGGSVYGVSELAAEIRASAKPVTAVANSLAASAAYWLGTAASEFFVTPGGEVGSIGVWMAHEDWSKAMEEAGVNVTLISAGKYKTEGHPYGPLDAEAKGFLQSRTDDYYGAFTRDVAKGRGVAIDAVRGGMGQGRVLGASQAKAENMVDGVMTFDQVVRHSMAKGKPAAGRSALAASQRRVQIAQLEG